MENKTIKYNALNMCTGDIWKAVQLSNFLKKPLNKLGKHWVISYQVL